MNRWLPRSFFAAALALGAGELAAQPQDDLAAYLETVRAEYHLPALAAAVTKDGAIVAIGAVGTRAVGLDIPVTLDDRFHIGSDTKAMTATIAGSLVDEGKLTWGTTLGEVFADTIEGMDAGLAAVTLAQLLSHSSGIPTDNDEIVALYYSLAELEQNPREMRLTALERWKDHAPKVPEGSPFQYANLGYMFAAAMLEKVSGTPWERLLVERIYEPLKLDTAGLGPQATFGFYDAPVGHNIDGEGKPVPMFWGPAADVPAALGPAGAAHMSIGDFARWAAWNAAGDNRSPAIVTPATLAEIHRPHVTTPPLPDPPPGTPQEGQYALGWGVIDFEWSDAPLLVHNGSNSMNLAKILVSPEAGLGIVVTTNYPGPDAEKAASAVQRHLYDEYVAR